MVHWPHWPLPSMHLLLKSSRAQLAIAKRNGNGHFSLLQEGAVQWESLQVAWAVPMAFDSMGVPPSGMGHGEIL